MVKIRYLVLAAVVFLMTIVGGIAVPSVHAGPTVQQPCGQGDACEGFIEEYINPIIMFLTVSVGVIAAISLVVAAIQYSSAGGDSGKVEKAKGRIYQTIVGIIVYIFLAAFINYLVPGGFIQ